EGGPRHAGDLGQGLVGGGQRVAHQDGVGAGAVVLGAGLVHVGDRRQPDLEPLAGEVGLLLQRGFLGLGGGQGLDRDQHVEVGLGGAGDQRVAGGFQGEVGGAA